MTPVSAVVTAFEMQAVRVGARVHRTTAADLVGQVLAILREAGCRSVALAQALPGRAELARAVNDTGLREVAPAELRPTQRADAGISMARLAVAETGSMLLHSSADDRRVELCVDVHLITVRADTLMPTLDGAFLTLRSIAGRPPAYASLVSGPSRSADIERQITIGVHGPREVHVLLLADLA